MKKITIIGHLALGKEFFDGQTIKTRIIARELDYVFGEKEVNKLDTYNSRNNLFVFFKNVLISLKHSENIIILPAQNGLRILVPMLVMGNLFKKRKIHYIVIGGWLPQYISKKIILKKCLKNIQFIYVETASMKFELERQRFKNVDVMSNCKNLNIIDVSNLICMKKEPYKVCTFSRVMKEKGIEDAIKAVININSKYEREVYQLDIYGQVSSNQEEWFTELQQNFPTYIKYKGVAAYDKSTEVLKNYFALLFPTYYEGEGFAGTLIDAMAAGVPVIATDWKYNSEIIKNGISGIIYQKDNHFSLENVLEDIINDIDKWNVMKCNCVLEARHYLPQVAMQILLERCK